MSELDIGGILDSVTQPKVSPAQVRAALGVAPEGGLAASAKQMVGQTIKGAGQLAADVAPTLMGDNAALRTGQEMIDANPVKVQGLRDIAESPWTAVKEAAGNAIPSMGGIIGLRALGSGITALAPAAGPAAPIVAGLGQAVSWGGPAALAALPSYSGIRGAQTEAGLEGTTTQKLAAAGGSVLSGVVEMAGGPQTRLLNALSSGLKRKAGESLTKAVGKEALKSGLEEAGEELVQSPIEQLASYQDPTTAKNIQDTLFGGAMGFIGGGVLGGGMQAIAQKLGDAPPTDQAGRDTATTEDVQGQSLSSIVGAPTIVSNGQAYFSSGNGEFVVAPVEKLTEHFAGGGSVDTFNTAQATQEQLDKVGKFSLGYLTELRNSDQALIQAGVNKKDVDALILSKVQDTPGRREYVASLLSSGRPDAQAVNEIGSGKIDSPNAPLQAEWMRQEEAAKVATANTLARINDEQNRIAREQARIEEENRVIDYWRSIGAVDTVEEGRRLAALRAPLLPSERPQQRRDFGPSPLYAEPNKVTEATSLMAAGVSTPEQRRAERLATYRELFSAVNKPAQDITALITRLESTRGDLPTQATTQLRTVDTQAQEEAERLANYRELFSGANMSKQDIAAFITRLESAREDSSSQPGVLGSPAMTDAMRRANRFADIIAAFDQQTSSPEGVTSPPVGELPPSAPAAAPSGGVSDQQLGGAAATTPAVAPQVDPTSFITDQQLGGAAATTPAVAPKVDPTSFITDQQLGGAAATTPAVTTPGDPTSFITDQQLGGAAATTPAVAPQVDPTSFITDQQLGGAAATTPTVTTPGDPTSFITDQQLRGAAATTPEVTVQPAPLRLPKKKPADLNALLASSNSGRTIARGLADISKDKPIAAIAKRVAVTLGKDVKVVVVNPGDSIPARAASALSNSAKGVYRSGDRTVYLRSDKFTDFNGVNDNTVLHELLHAATFDRLRAGNKASQKGTDLANATSALYKLQNTIADRFNAEIRSGEFYTKYSEDVQGVIRYAAFDVDEMISYGLSNAKFQNVLKTIQYKNTNETMFSQFTKLIRRLLGLSAKDQSALTSLIDMTDTLLSLPEPAVAVINGQRVLKEEVLFKPVDVNSANFKRWFGDSKIVDENGKPLVVYHGTASAFDSFSNINLGGATEHPTALLGHHFSDNPEATISFSDRPGGTTYAGFLSIKKPLVLTVREYFRLEENEQAREFKKDLIKRGYDGIKVLADGKTQETSGNMYIAFSPNQIKSAISNTGEFTLEDDRILFEQAGRSLFAAQSDAADKVRALASGAKVEYAPRWLSVMPLHTLVQTVGTKIKQVKRVEDILNEAEHISESMVTESMQYYTNAQNSKQAEKINLVAGLASFYRVTPWKNIDAEVDWVPTGQKTRADKLKAAEDKWKAAGMDKATGKSFVAAHTEAKRAFDALNPEAQKAYRAIVSHMQDIRQREKNNLRTFIEKSSAGNDDLKQQLLTRFNSTFNDVRGAYWPLSRIGDFRLEYVDLDGTKVVQFFESDAARRDEMQELQTSGVDQQSFRLSFKDKRPRGEVAIPIELMTQLSTAVRNQKLSEASNDDPGAIASAEAEAQEIIDEMNQIWLRWQPETSALKNSLRRQNVKGFDQDMLRAYIEYTRKHAGNIAWTEQGRKLEDTLKSLHTEIIDDRNSGQDPTFKGMVLNDLRARLQAMREAKVGPIASFLGKVGTMWYMTSPSIALVQMTQLPILTLPKLAVKYGLGKATSAMGKGLRMAFSKDYTKDKLFGNLEVDALHDWLRMTVTAEMLENKGKNPLADRQLGNKQLGDFLYTKEDIEFRYKQLSPEQQRIFILREALARNLLDISAAHEAYSLTQGKDPNSLTNKAFRLAMAPMRLSELASRKAAILSTMELSKEQGKGFFDTIKDVGEVVNDTLYSYSKANKPAFLQSGTARVLAMFQWYRIMTALRIGLMFKRSIAAETPEIRAAAQKEFIGIMGMTALLAGTLGLPLAKTVFSALDALADDDEPRDSELEFRKWAAERFGPEFGKIFTHGLPAAAGLNLTKRIGLDNLYGFQSEPPPRLHGKELALWYAGSQLGPAFGVFQSAFQGYDLMSKGEYMKGLEAALPKSIKDGLKALRVGQEGELTSMSGKRVIGGENLTGDAVLLMALGINPTEVEEAQTSSYAASKISVRISERRGRLIDGSVKAILGDGDRDAAREAMLEFNKKMPRFAITGGDIRNALRRYRMEELGAKSKRDKMVAMQYEIPSY